MFTAVDGILFRPPPGVERPSELFRLYQGITTPPTGETVSRTFSYPQFAALQAELGPIAGVAAVASEPVSVGLGVGARPEVAEFVTSELFPVIGIRMLRGRAFSADDARPPAGNTVAMVSEQYWRRVLDARPDVLGQQIIVSGRNYVIIGVVAQPFEGVSGSAVDLWLPLSAAGLMFHGETWDFKSGDQWIQIVGRYRARAMPQMITARATQVLAPTAGQARTADASGRTRALVGPIQLALGPGRTLQAKVSMWLLWMATAVLLVGCVNIANLYVVRAVARRRELTLRMALGATVWSLLWLLLAESSILSAVGGAVGVAIAALLQSAMQSLVSQGSATAAPHTGLRVLLVALASTGAIAAASALLPLVGIRRTEITSCLKDGGPHATSRKSRLRSSLAATQVALAALLLVGAGLFVHTLRAVFAIDLGMEPARVLVVRVDLASVGRSQREIDQFYRLSLDRLRHLPTVASASLGTTVPFYSGFAVYLATPGERPLSERTGSMPYVNVVTPDFFQTLGMRIIKGRAFGENDRGGSERVAVVSRALAGALWPDHDALGKCMQVGSATAPCTYVVGVVADAARDRPTDAPPLQYFLPFDQQDSLASTRALFLRTRVPPDAAAGDVRREIQAQAPYLPYPSVTPLQQLIEPQVRPWRTAASLFTAFATIAVLLALLGLHTVIAYATVERRKELAIRFALGSTPGRVLGLVARDGLKLSGAGILCGLGAAALAAPKVAPLLFETSTLEPAAYVGAGLILLLCGMLASAGPALRAAAISPAEVLRSD